MENPYFEPKITTIAELQGIVAKIADVVKQLTTNVSQASQTVRNMAQIPPAQAQVNTSQVLRMPSMHISEFIECFTQQTAHLPVATRFSLLEQQWVGEWPRSVLSFA